MRSEFCSVKMMFFMSHGEFGVPETKQRRHRRELIQKPIPAKQDSISKTKQVGCNRLDPAIPAQCASIVDIRYNEHLQRYRWPARAASKASSSSSDHESQSQYADRATMEWNRIGSSVIVSLPYLQRPLPLTSLTSPALVVQVFEECPP